jgi:glyoxylase-like metal-dependent hydrolase (beta-lactamase superfamily II)
MERLTLRTIAAGPWGTNAYVLICPDSLASMLIDPGGDPPALAAMLAGSKPVAILVTHSHPDHIGALAEMKRQLKVPVMAHPGAAKTQAGIRADRWLADGDRLQLGSEWLSVYHTPGHTDDQVCFRIESDHRTVVGDTLFEGGPGKTWSAAGFRTTRETLKRILSVWTDDTVCYPGHGASFRLGDKRTAIEAFVRKDHGNICGDATWDM